jgi:hypothetical protein
MPTLDRRFIGIPAEAVELFVKLERGPAKEREAFSDGSHELARMLDLTIEWWTGNTPCDRSPRPHMSEAYASHWDWHECRRVREELMREAVRRGL